MKLPELLQMSFRRTRGNGLLRGRRMLPDLSEIPACRSVWQDGRGRLLYFGIALSGASQTCFNTVGRLESGMERHKKLRSLDLVLGDVGEEVENLALVVNEGVSALPGREGIACVLQSLSEIFRAVCPNPERGYVGLALGVDGDFRPAARPPPRALGVAATASPRAPGQASLRRAPSHRASVPRGRPGGSLGKTFEGSGAAGTGAGTTSGGRNLDGCGFGA